MAHHRPSARTRQLRSSENRIKVLHEVRRLSYKEGEVSATSARRYSVNKTILQNNERVRRIAISGYHLMARAMVFNPPPRVLANGVPKSGTHLLVSLLRSFPRMMFSGRHYALPDFGKHAEPTAMAGEIPEVDWDRLGRALAAVNEGQFMTAHFPALPELVSVLRMLDYKTIVILRDPRDIVVSNAFYIARLKRHFLHARFNTEFSNTNERIMACITGFPPNEHGRGLISIGDRLRQYAAWLEDPNTYSCRFEELVGPRGGGEAEQQRRAIETIASHIDRKVAPDEVHTLAEKAWSPRSSTFRKGVIGDWRNHFTEAHKEAFKEVAGRELVALRYETALSW